MEAAAEYVFAWLVREGRPGVAGRADAESDQAAEAGRGRLYELIAARLGPDPALERTREEAAEGRADLSEHTRQWLTDSLQDAAGRDEEFAAALKRLVEQLALHAPADGFAASGDHVDFRHGTFHAQVVGTQHNHYGALRPQAVWPHQVGVIPLRAGSFQDRAETVQLRDVLAGGQAAVLVGQNAVPGQVLAGMGGVGKTQLAADYARAAWGNGTLDVLVWVTATARPPVVAGYAQAGVELCGADPDDPEEAAQTFLAWLTYKANQEPCRWLVVLDDVADPDDLRGLWPPASRYGRTLVTTRRRDAALTGADRHLITVGLFTEAEATAYRALLADRATRLADTAPDALPDDQALPLAAAWSLSVDRADTLRPAGLARPMLQLAAMLDANGIPEAVLNSSPALAYLATYRTHSSQALPTPIEAVGALRALHRLNLIDHTPTTAHKTVRVHQLIQRATRDTLTLERHHHTARTAADALMAAWPDIERDIALAQALRANTAALAGCAEDALHTPDMHGVLYRTGHSLGSSGQVSAAASHFQHLRDTTTGNHGPDHPDTLTTRHELARWQGQAGDAAGAAAAFAQLLSDRVRVLGEDHPDTLTTRRELAYWRVRAGDGPRTA